MVNFGTRIKDKDLLDIYNALKQAQNLLDETENSSRYYMPYELNNLKLILQASISKLDQRIKEVKEQQRQQQKAP